MSRWLLPLATFLAVSLTVAAPSWAQSPAKPDKPDTAFLEDDDPYVVQLRQRAATGDPMQVAGAIAGFARTGFWTDLDQILTTAAGAKRDDAVAAEMARHIGSPLLVRMVRSDQLSQPAKNFVATLSEKLAKAEVSPERLREAIDNLDAVTADEQLAAIRTLLAGGDASIRELVMAVVSPQPSADLDTLLRTMLRLGDGGIAALRQLAIYGLPDERAKAMTALARISAKSYVADLVTAFHAADSTPEERTAAVKGMQRTGIAMPSQADTIEYLAGELARAAEVARFAIDDDEVVGVWDLQADRKGVQKVEAFAALAASHARADAAARLHRLDSVPVPLQRSALIAELSYRVTVDPLWGDPDQVDAIREMDSEIADASFVSSALDQAIHEQDWPAAVGLIKLVGETSDAAEVDSWLFGQTGQPSPLVRAASAPVPRVRYEAAAAITRLKPQSAYAGSSLVQSTLSEMAHLSRRPIAILVETIPEMISRQDTFLTNIGFQADTVSSVAELERRVAAGGDLRLVMSKSGIADARPIELVDRVRRLSAGELLPIIIYTDEQDVLGPETFQVPTVQMPAPLTTVPIQQLLTRWQRPGQLPPLIESERTVFRTIGRNALTGINQD